MCSGVPGVRAPSGGELWFLNASLEDNWGLAVNDWRVDKPPSCFCLRHTVLLLADSGSPVILPQKIHSTFFTHRLCR